MAQAKAPEIMLACMEWAFLLEVFWNP